MPPSKQQTPKNIIENIEAELKFLKEFLEKENQSTSLLDLINSGKAQELINNTTSLQSIFLHDEDSKIKRVILNLFKEVKNKVSINQLNDIQGEYEKNKQDEKKLSKLINTYKNKQNPDKNKQNPDEQIKYIYLLILFRKIPIVNLVKLKSLTDLIGQNESSDYIEILQNKFSEQGRTGQLALVHLNNIFDEDTEKELKRLGAKKIIKRPPLQAVQSEQATIVEPTTTSSLHLNSLSNSSSSEKNSTSIPSHSDDTKPSTELPLKENNSKVLDSLLKELNNKTLTIRDLNSKIISLENEVEQLTKQTKKETHPETSAVKAGLDNIKSLLQNRQNTTHTEELNKREDIIKDLKSSLKNENEKIKALTDEIEALNSQHKKSIQKLKAELNQAQTNLDQSQKSVDISSEDAEKSKKAMEDLKKRVNNLQTEYDLQHERFKKVNSELVSTKKLLKEAQDDLSKKEIHLEEIDIQLKETKETASQLKNLQPHLNAANEKIIQLNHTQSSLETEITAIKSENQKLNIELKASQAQKAKLENTLDKLGNTLQSNESKNQTKLEAIEKIQKLKESEINSLKTELIDTQRKSEKFEQNIAQLTIALNKITDEKATLHQNLAQAQEKVEVLEKEKSNHHNKLKELSENSSADNKKIYEIQSQLDSLNNSNEELEAYILELTAQKKTKDDVLNELTTELQLLKLELEKVNQINMQLKNNETLLLDNSSQLKSKEELDKEIIELKKSSQQSLTLLTNLENENRNLKETLKLEQQNSSQAEDEKNNLLGELDKLSKTNSFNQERTSSLESQMEELDKFRTHSEKSIQQLNNKIIEQKTDLKNSYLKLTEANQKVQQLNQTLNSIEAEKVTLENKLAQLEQENGELQQELNQASAAKDIHLTELKQEKRLNEDELKKVQNELKNLEEKLENNQTAYSESKQEYAKLKKIFEEQSQELNLIKTNLKASNAQLESTYAELENLKSADAKQFNQEELSSSKKEEGSMENEELTAQAYKPIYQEEEEEVDSSLDTKSKVDPISLAKHSDSSSGHSSRSSSSTDLNEEKDFKGFKPSQQVRDLQQPLSSDDGFSDASSNDPQSLHPSTKLKSSQSEPNLLQSSDKESLSLSETEDESARNTDSRPSTPDNASLPEQQDRDATPEEVKQGLNAAFNQENHPEIINALIKKFLQIATDTANKLFNGNVTHILPRFKPELETIASEQITQSIFPYINSPDFKTKLSEIIHSNKLTASNYLEEVINSTELIFALLTIGQPAQKYKAYIADQGKNLLIKLCIENLQTNDKENLFQHAKKCLENQATLNNLQATEYAETIQKTASELVTEQLETKNLQKTLKRTARQPITVENLLEASQQKLQDQLEQQISDNFVHYFPNLLLDPILEKINNGKALSSEEIAKLPSELQYTDTTEEFISGLRVNYPNLSSSYENKMNEDTFKKTRLILRKNALNAFQLAAFEDEEIHDLSAKNWLEKKLGLITKKSISLKLDKKDQKDLDNNFQKYFRLSSLEDMAITHKSIAELKNALKKLNDFKLKTTTELSKIFSEIELKLPEYPNLITKDGAFEANLNNSLPPDFPKLNATDKYPSLSIPQIQIILDKINQHIDNDVSKWSLLNNDKIAQEIANNIISDSTNPFESGTDIHRIVSDSLTILYKFHDLQETLEKRKHWNSEIQQHYALTQKLKSSSHFNQMIEDRISKLEEMLDLKENDADENVKALPKGVYLPNKCRIIPNFQFDSTDTEEYHLQVENFYKQDALKVGQTITFSQKLSNDAECKWSATLNTDKCLSFKTQKKRFRREKNYLQEVSFAQMIYSVNSFKDAKTCTLNFGNCSQNMKERLYLFAKAYNELRLEDNELQKRPKIICHIKNPPNLDKAKIAAVKEEIKAQLNLHRDELEDISTKLKDDTMRHQIIRSRG